MATEKQLFERLADAFGDAARANERIAQAFAQLAETRAAPAAPAERSPAPPKPPVLKLSVDDNEEADDDLKPAARRILAALAGSAEPLSKGEICVRAGLTYKSGTTDGALADLRQGGFIATEGQRNSITGAGLACQFPELPKGYALFEYWIEQLGGKDSAPARVLLALRSAYRDGKLTASKDEICTISGLTYKSGTTDGALAKVRKLELVQTLGQRNQLHPDLREALVPTIGVHNTKTGESVRVKAR
jgi:hypothetical protein